jgi:CubicO group peptidase (beta-lactamase class C family)
MRPSARAVRLSLVLGLGLVPWTTSAAAPPSSEPTAARLDGIVERARHEFEIPGVGLAVVKDGRVLIAKGYGVRTLGATTAVDEGTLFAIASNTKAFTAAALGLLAEDGALDWSDPVARRLPGFEMYDPYVSREMTIRDLLTHRSGLGLGEGDLLYFPPSTFTRREIVAKVRALKPASSFRSRYAYDNVLYIVAGEVVSATSGTTWEGFVRDRLLRPLGLADTVPTASEIPAGANAASPHARVDGVVKVVASDDADNIAAAGGIRSSARDMGRWTAALLAAAGGAKGVLPRRVVEEMWTAQTPIPIGDVPAALAPLKPRFLSYGLGFQIRDYHGRRLLTHTGGLAGMVSRVALVPEEGVAIVVLTNQESDGGRDAIAYGALDAALGLPATDWTVPFLDAERAADAQARAAVAAKTAARAAASRPSLPLASYARRYRDPWYGEAAIALEAGHLVLRFSRSPALTGDLEHWQYDTFVARWRDRGVPDAFVTFALGPDGSIDHFKMAAVSPAADFSYDYQDLLFTPVAER